MKRFASFFFFTITSLWFALGQTNGYFVQFADKAYSEYSIDLPEEFLSQRAIERRQRQNIAIAEDDLPVSAVYVDSLKKLNLTVKHTTKWLNGAIVFTADTELMDTLDSVSFVSFVEMTKQGVVPGAVKKFDQGQAALKYFVNDEYGKAWDQIRTVNGHLLHQKGYLGNGMQIAVIDAGFNSVESLPLFQHLWDNGQILGTKDFVNPDYNIFEEHYHGMKVLSIIGGQMDGVYKGTAPEASFWLLRTEDDYSETPIEPDYWMCAAEFADSAGVDIINSSLGYYNFDYPFNSYTYADVDGTSRASRAAEIAASKGMVVVLSAGNEGNNAWHYVGVPADARDILSVAAMAADSTRAPFSSYGPSYDKRVKPELAAMGSGVAVQGLNGGVELGSGTSYSTPVIAGMVACLWQALPNYSARQLVGLILQNSNQCTKPDDSFGYGIPDFNAAVQTGVNTVEINDMPWCLKPNPFSDYIIVSANSKKSVSKGIRLTVYDLIGNKVVSRCFAGNGEIKLEGLSPIPKGVYILLLESEFGKQHFKILKK